MSRRGSAGDPPPPFGGGGRGLEPVRTAFSLVEIIAGLVVLSLLAGITITLYDEDIVRSKEEASRVQCRDVVSAIRRWELANRRRYPYSTAEPLLGRYLEGRPSDPWGADFLVDSRKGVVYSPGPNGIDDGAAGDDVLCPIRRPGRPVMEDPADPEAPIGLVEVCPEAPRNLRATQRGEAVELEWEAPVFFEDGTLISEAEGLSISSYRIYRRAFDEGRDKEVPLQVSGSQTTFSEQLGGLDRPNVTYYYEVSAVVRAGGEDCEGPRSPQAGIFIAKETQPRINVFSVSSKSVPLGRGKLTIDLDVTDADNDLQSIVLTFDGTKQTIWSESDASRSGNKFHVVFTSEDMFLPKPRGLGFDFPVDPKTVTDLSVTVKDSKGGNSVTTDGPDIAFTNTRPVITLLRASKTNLVLGSNGPTFEETVTFSIDARDNELNLTSLKLVPATPDPSSHPKPRPQESGSEEVKDAGGKENLSLSVEYRFSTTRTSADELVIVDMVATATDRAALSTASTLKVVISADQSPPETPVVNINPSNPFLVDDRSQKQWWVRDPSAITGTWSSFEAETPPVHYRIGISKSSTPVSSWTVPDPFEGIPGEIPEAVTQGPGGWYSPPNDTANTVALSVGRGLVSTLVEGETYNLAVVATNSANPARTNTGTGVPVNLKTGFDQNPFGVDSTPPNVGPVIIETSSRGNCAFSTGQPRYINGESGLTAQWPNATDNASDVRSYRYRVLADPPGPGPILTVQDWTDTDSREVRELPLKSPGVLSFQGYTIILEVLARDTAGNLSTTTGVAKVIVDDTPPVAENQPIIITDPDTPDVLTDANNFEGRWDGVFVDPESPQALSYEWGISSTFPVQGVPDIFPGAWQPEQGTVGLVKDQPNLLTNGDTVYLVVRAINCAGATSLVTASKGILVRTELFSSLTPTPPTGFKDLEVELRADVIGGDPPYDYTFDFDDGSDPVSVSGTAETSVVRPHTYTELGSFNARVTVEDSEGNTSFAFAGVRVLPQPYVLSLNTTSLSVIDLAENGGEGAEVLSVPLATGTTVSPRKMHLVDVSDELKFVLYSGEGTGGAGGGVYRFDLDSNETRGAAVALAESGDEPDRIHVSPDGRFVLLTNGKDGVRTLRRLKLDPRIDYGVSDDTDLGLVPSLPRADRGSARGAVALDGGAGAWTVDGVGPALARVGSLDVAQPTVLSTSPLFLKDPGMIDMTRDRATAVISDRGGTSIAVIDSVPDSVRLTEVGFRTLEASMAAEANVAFFGESGGSRVVRVETSTRKVTATTAVPGGDVVGLDTAADGSLVAVATSAGAVQVLSGKDLVRRASVAVTSGSPRDVVLFEKPSFGRPVVSRVLNPDAPKSEGKTTVSAGGTVLVRGYNFSPTGTLSAQLLPVSTGTPQSLTPRNPNGFNRFELVIPPGTPSADYHVQVTNDIGVSSTGPSSEITVE